VFAGGLRLKFDRLDKFWKMDTLAMGGSYFWCAAFNAHLIEGDGL
jgi:hypothetical protein